MNRVVVQIPMDVDLRNKAEKAVVEQGFSTLQDFTRLVYRKLVQNRLEVKLGEPPVQLSAKALKRYDKMTRDIESGKTKLKWFNSVDDLMKDLNS